MRLATGGRTSPLPLGGWPTLMRKPSPGYRGKNQTWKTSGLPLGSVGGYSHLVDMVSKLLLHAMQTVGHCDAQAFEGCP